MAYFSTIQKAMGAYCNIQYENIGADTNTNTIPPSFSISPKNCCSFSGAKPAKTPEIRIVSSLDGNRVNYGQENILCFGI